MRAAPTQLAFECNRNDVNFVIILSEDSLSSPDNLNDVIQPCNGVFKVSRQRYQLPPALKESYLMDKIHLY